MGREVTVFSSRIDRSDLRPGDHIYVWRGIYSHHGIYESDKKVIHFTIPEAESTSSSPWFASKSSSTAVFATAQTCREWDCVEAKRKGGVISTCLDCFLEDDNLCLFVYSVSEWFSKMSNIGVQDTCSTEPEESPHTVLQRANDLLAHGFGDYDLALNNCFDFAFYCKTGRRYIARGISVPSERLFSERHYTTTCVIS